ncbi:MAG: phage Gp37/Gp68 family protein [Candidatus Eisenbacteria bacterium]|nr:phage Gp37/Gp68 family protein [Candidatus Eisenbacteria bacterium]
MAISRIEWTEMSWNPVTGCSKLSAGCKNCYAEVLAKRLCSMGSEKYVNGFEVATHPEALPVPFKWKTPRMVFVNSMSDLFHDAVPLSFILEVFKVMNQCRRHQFQVLTKRPKRLVSLDQVLPWSANIWMGVSVENEEVLGRVDWLRKCSAKVKFLSLEPLLGPLNHLSLAHIDWVIVGGESGSRARPTREEWVLEIRNKCADTGVPFFFKQWGGANRKKAGRLLCGRTYEQMPPFAAEESLLLA